MSFEFFPLSLNVLVYAHASVGVFTRTPFFLSLLVDSLEHLWMPDRIFPKLKGRKNVLLYFLSSFSTIGWRCLLAGVDAVVTARPKVFRISVFVVPPGIGNAVRFKRCIVTIVLLKDNSIRI